MQTSLQRLGQSLKRAQWRDHRTMDTALRAVGVSLVQWDVLRAIDSHPYASGHELAGMTLHFSVIVQDVRAATDEEKAAASSAFLEPGANDAERHPELDEAMKAAFQGLAGKRHLPN